MKKVNIFKLEDRVLFDAAGVADAVDAANQAASAEASAAQEQAQDSKEALKNAPPENPADAAANAQAQQNHSNPGEAADLDAAANKIVEGEIVPGQAPEQADAPADGADVDASAADTDGEAPDADHAAAESQGGDSGDAGDAGDINDVPLGDIDDFINGGHDSDADHDGDAEHNAEQDSADADKPAPALDAVPAAANADAPGRELVIINSSVKDAQAIIDALGDNTDVLFLEKGTDALDAINDYLDANGIKYDAIHIVSHGNAGYFVLNGEVIDAQSVANDPAAWANIGKHLSDNGDIMIYGCNVAGNLDGQMLVSQIASLTGADVAASVDNTGVDGNWDLEYSIGVIDHQFINVSGYQYTLASEKIDVGNNNALSDALNSGVYDEFDELVITITKDELTDSGTITFKADVSYVFQFYSWEVVDKDGKPTGEIRTITDEGPSGYHFYFNGTVNFNDTTIDLNNFTNTSVSKSVNYIFDGNVNFSGMDVDVSVNRAVFDASAAMTTLNGGSLTLNLENGGNGGTFRFNDLAITDSQTLNVSGVTLSLSGNNRNDHIVTMTGGTLRLAANASFMNNGSFNADNTDVIGSNDTFLMNQGTMKVNGLTVSSVNNTASGILSIGGRAEVGTLENGAQASVELRAGSSLVVGVNGDLTVRLTNNGTISGSGDVDVYSGTAGSGTVDMQNGRFIYRNTLPENFYRGTYHDLGYVLAAQQTPYLWSALQLPPEVVVGGSVLIGCANGATSKDYVSVIFDFADTNFKGVSFLTENFDAVSNTATGIFSQVFLAAQGYTLQNCKMGNIQIGNGSEVINSDVTLSGLVLRGTYIDATRMGEKWLYLNSMAVFAPNQFQLLLSVNGDGVARTSVGYSGSDQYIFAARNGNTTNHDIISYSHLTVRGTAQIAGDVQVYNSLTLGDSTTVTIDSGRLTLGSSSRNIDQIYDVTTSAFRVTGGSFSMYIGSGQNVNSRITASSGNLYLRSTGDSVYLGDIILTGTAQATLAGADTTFRGVVGIGAATTAQIKITGDNFKFTNDVTTAYGWYNTGHYLYDDNRYYGDSRTQSASTIGNYNGKIILDLERVDNNGLVTKEGTKISFNGMVVTLGEFSIVNAGSVTFSQLVAVAGGVFNVGTGGTGSSVGTVQFSGNVYVSSNFNGVDTTLNLRADTTNFAGDLWNWVRVYRFLNDYDKQYGMDFMKDADGKFYLNILGTMTTTVNIERGTVTFNSASTVYNIGVFGQAGFNIMKDARVTLTNVHNVAYQGYDPGSGAHPVWYSRGYLAYQKYFFGNLTAGSDYPLDWDYNVGSFSQYAHFSINGNNNVIIGDVYNLGNFDAVFTVNGVSNAFRGDFTNATGGIVYISGEKNYFVNLTNQRGFAGHSYEDRLYSEVTVTGMHYFDQVINGEHMAFNNPGSSRLNLISNSNRAITTISGNAEGFSFTGLEITAGQVTLDAEFGMDKGYGIDVDITLGAQGILVVNKANEFRGDINNGGHVSLNADGIVLNGTVNNLANGSFNLEKEVVVNGAVNNAGAFKVGAANMIFGEHNTFTNQSGGTITIGHYSIFNALVNLAGGTVVFGEYADGTIFRDLNNAGTFNVTNAKNVVFDNSLINSGTLTVTSAAEGVRFLNMLDSKTGEVKFVNSGSVRLDGNLTDQISVQNQKNGSIIVGQNARLEFAKVINAGTITAGLKSELLFYGEVAHSGVITGDGNVTFYNKATGNGTFSMSGVSTVTYAYDDSYNNDAQLGAPDYETSTVYKNNDGYWVVGGVVVSDSYSNRPIWSDVYGWVFSDAPTTPVAQGQSKYVTVSINENHQWVIGTENTGKSVHTVDTRPTLNAETNMWEVNGVATGIKNAVPQDVFGGTLVNLTVSGDATIPSGETTDDLVGLAVNGNTTVSGEFRNEGMTLVVSGSMTFKGSYIDNYDRETSSYVMTAGDVDSALRVTGAGKVTFDISSQAVSGRREAEVYGQVFNSGIITITANKALFFHNETSGTGAVAATSATVIYDGVTGIEQNIFASSGTTAYGELILSGGDKLISGSNIVEAQQLINNSKLTVTDSSSFTVNEKVTGNGNYVIGMESRITFNSTSSTGYSFGAATSTIVIEEGAFGVVFRGASESNRVVFNGVLTNNVKADADGHFGVTASYAGFGKVINKGTFSVKDTGVTLGEFTLNPNAELVFGLKAGDEFKIDGVNSKLIGEGGNIEVQAGKLTINKAIVKADGSNASTFQINSGATLEVDAVDSQTLPFVVVDTGATLIVRSNTVIGADGSYYNKENPTSGLVLNGTLQVYGGNSTIWAYQSAAGADAKIYVEGTATKLTFDGTPDLYGYVGASIEVAAGQDALADPYGRINTVPDYWIVINGNDKTSNYAAGSKFIVNSGATLTVDGYLDANDNQVLGNVEEVAFRLATGSELLVKVELTVSGEVTAEANSTITVNAGSKAEFNGSFASGGLITGFGGVVFNGAVTNYITDSTGLVHEGNIIMLGDGSIVTYGENAGSVLFAGTYIHLVVNNAASVGNVEIAGSLSGTGSVTFNGTTAGKATVKSSDGENGKGTLSVTYNATAETVYGGTYSDLTIVGDHIVNRNNEEVLKITVDGAMSISGGSSSSPVTLTLNNTELTFNGMLNNTDSAEIAVSGKLGVVTYHYEGYNTQDIYSGSYRDLVIESEFAALSIARLNLSGTLSGAGTLIITTSATGDNGRVVANKEGKFLSVSYGDGVLSGFFGGDYQNLSISGAGDKTISNDIVVHGDVFAMGSFRGQGNLEFMGRILGSATFGTGTAAYAGSVTYSGSSIAQTIYGGHYSSLIFSNDAKTINLAVTVDSLTTSSDISVEDGAEVTFKQTVVDGSSNITVGRESTLNITLTAGRTQPVFSNSGTLVVTGQGGVIEFNGQNLTNNGLFRVSGNSVVVLNNIKIDNALSSYEVDAGSRLTLAGFHGVDEKGEQVPVTVAGLTSNGELVLDGSALVVNGAVACSGSLVMKTASVLTLMGDSVIDGTVDLGIDNTLNVYSTVRIENLILKGEINVGRIDENHPENNIAGNLTLKTISPNYEPNTPSLIHAYLGSLIFEPAKNFQMIGGKVVVESTATITYDKNWTGFYDLVIDTPWIIVTEDMTINVTDNGKYWIQNGATLTVNGCGKDSQFKVDGDSALIFNVTATETNPGPSIATVTVLGSNPSNPDWVNVTINGPLAVTGDFQNSGKVEVNSAGVRFNNFQNQEGGVLTLNVAVEGVIGNQIGGTIDVNADDMTFGSNITNAGILNLNTGNMTLGGMSNTGLINVGENAAAVVDGLRNSGTITVSGTVTLKSDIANGGIYGTYNVQKNGRMTVDAGLTELNSNVNNAGTITAEGALTFNGAVVGNNGLFGGTSFTFLGETSGTASFNADDVVFGSTTAQQQIFSGQYQNLTLAGLEKKIAADITVNGLFSNKSGVQVAAGVLTLNQLAGAGSYTVGGQGTVIFGSAGSTVAGSVTNSGTVEVNALVSFGGGLSNLATGTLNLNATGLNVTADNAGVINVNAQNVTLSGSNSKTVNVADGGSLTLKMTDAAGANYTVAADGVLNLDSASGTLFGRVDNAGTFNVISVVDSFVGGVSNSGTMVVESASNLANVTNSNLLILNGAAKLNGTVNDGTIQLNNGGVSVEGLANNGILDITVGYTFDASKFTNDGLVKVSNGATVTANNIGANGSSGDYSVEANSTLNARTNARFTGVLENDGTISGNGNRITISGSTAGSGSLNNSSGEVVYNGAAAQDIFSGEYGRLTVTGDGTKTLNGDITINTNGNISSSFVNNGAITSDGALIFDGKTSGNGTVKSTAETIYNQAAEHVYSGKYGKLTLSGVAKSIAGNVTADLLDNSARTLTVETSGVLTTGKLVDGVNSQYNILGTWNFTGDAEILGSVNNSGVISTDSDLTFTGMTTGSGRIEISNTTGAVKYSGNADHEIYSGNYNDLTIDGTGNNTLSGDVKVNGTMSLDTRLNASGSLTLSGDTTGEGQLHSTGSVVYDRNGDQDIYNGSYKDITIDGNGVKSIVGNVTISGNAVQSGGAVLHASNGNVTYNGNGTQQVMNGTYDDLTLNGTGQKLFAAGSLTTVNGTFTATGSPSQLLYLDSTIPGRQWDVAAGNLNFNWVHISNSNLLSGGADLNGNNSLGSGNTGWKVFDSAGGIGDSFPSQNNLNFSSLAMLLGNELRAAELEELFYEEGFVFRRSGSLPKLDPNGDDIAAVLQSEVDFLGLETAYDTAIFDGADFSDADYSDLMSRADIFKDEVDEALSEMVAI